MNLQQYCIENELKNKERKFFLANLMNDEVDMNRLRYEMRKLRTELNLIKNQSHN